MQPQRMKAPEHEGLIALYYLLIQADGKISDKELEMGEIMCRHEKIDSETFQIQIKNNDKVATDELYAKCVQSLKLCDEDFKLKTIAWMSLIANSDGFMSPDEWKLIYKIYCKELNLRLDDILAYQKSLPRN